MEVWCLPTAQIGPHRDTLEDLVFSDGVVYSDTCSICFIECRVLSITPFTVNSVYPIKFSWHSPNSFFTFTSLESFLILQSCIYLNLYTNLEEAAIIVKSTHGKCRSLRFSCGCWTLFASATSTLRRADTRCLRTAGVWWRFGLLSFLLILFGSVRSRCE